jgi:stage II sporulation protein D
MRLWTVLSTILFTSALAMTAQAIPTSNSLERGANVLVRNSEQFLDARVDAAKNLFFSSLQQPSKPLILRVLLSQQSKANLIFPTSHNATYTDGTLLSQSTTPLEWNLSIQNGKIAIITEAGLFDTGHNRLVFQTDFGGYFQFAGRVYRGAAIITVRGGTLNIVNALDVEDYVRGVTPSEMPSSWPDEALKAQTIIARTYAIAKLNQSGDYDVCPTAACQVYGGSNAETIRGNAAADATRGLIVSWNDRPATTYFSSDSGGYTASGSEIWGINLPYLQARPDPLSTAPNNPWSLRISSGTIQSVVNRYAAKAGSFRSISIPARTESGRPSALDITGSSGSVRVSGTNVYAFIRALGAKSSLIGISSNSPLVLEGYGNGHGVGLSQYGARGLAASGWTFDQILGYYYVGVSLANYEVTQ